MDCDFNGVNISLGKHFTGQADLKRHGRRRQNTRTFILDSFFLNNVKNEDLTFRLFQDFIMQHFFMLLCAFSISI